MTSFRVRVGDPVIAFEETDDIAHCHNSISHHPIG